MKSLLLGRVRGLERQTRAAWLIEAAAAGLKRECLALTVGD